MERVLNQEEIDAMVRQARGTSAEDTTKESSVEVCTFHRDGQLASEQVRTLTTLHEGFARNLALSLGAYLGVPFEARLVSVEQLTYGELLERLPDITYVVLFRVAALDAVAAMQLDHSIVFPAVDLLLGGTGQCPALVREVTEVEESVTEGVAKIICRELENAWSACGIAFEVEGRQPRAQMQRFLSATEKTLCLSLEIKLAGAEGVLNLVFPAAISSELLRKLKVFMIARMTGVRHVSARLRERMLDCPFDIDHSLDGIELSIEQLATLAIGNVYNLGIPARRAGLLTIGGKAAFEATAARHKNQRAAQVMGRLHENREEGER